MIQAYLKLKLPEGSVQRWILIEARRSPSQFLLVLLRSWIASRKLTKMWWPIRVRIHPDARLSLNIHHRSITRFDGNLIVEPWGGYEEVSSVSLGEDATFVVAGDFVMGPGVHIGVSSNGFLFLGGRKTESSSGITCRSRIMCEKFIYIGTDSVIAWGVFITDSDWHTIKGSQRCLPVCIGDHVWISHDVSVLKGAQISNGCIVAAKSIATARQYPPHCLLAGQPAEVKRNGIEWAR